MFVDECILKGPLTNKLSSIRCPQTPSQIKHVFEWCFNWFHDLFNLNNSSWELSFLFLQYVFQWLSSLGSSFMSSMLCRGGVLWPRSLRSRSHVGPDVVTPIDHLKYKKPSRSHVPTWYYLIPLRKDGFERLYFVLLCIILAGTVDFKECKLQVLPFFRRMVT